MRKIITLLAALGLGTLAAHAEPLQDGARAFNRADYRTALASWRPLALQGNPVAQNNLGIMYLDGKGVPQNTSEAIRYVSLSAAAGIVTARVFRATSARRRSGSPLRLRRATAPACTIWD